MNRRWQCYFLLALVPAASTLVVGLRALRLDGTPLQPFLSYFQPLVLGTAEGVVLIFLAHADPGKGIADTDRLAGEDRASRRTRPPGRSRGRARCSSRGATGPARAGAAPTGRGDTPATAPRLQSSPSGLPFEE